MTKYCITRYEGESHPCAIADPAGCFYSTGEVDRVIKASKDNMDEMQTLIADMLAWFKWFQLYPSIAVQEFVTKGRKFEGRDTDDERAAETVPQGNPRAEG